MKERESPGVERGAARRLQGDTLGANLEILVSR